MSNPAAPLEKAVEEAREALANYDGCKGYEADEYATCCIEPFRLLLAALDADRGEAETIIRTIVENHFARITERGVLVYGQPVADTGFAPAILWLARREGKETTNG